ncbi:DUF7507 domain-containing protein [Natranaerobius trueperi]|uniref:DUF7507 domain-containing protein n=1 Tax=Natranaerobius trueperi TaxID=759412 RepID=A0A226BXU9_9FIRM|nr:hypothetical protein [Natranaerobius trueperi]OWZ83826.1 hypothetical protein CDO51_06190 [Natranaerobius trueperi]
MTTIGGINLGNLTDYLFFFADGRNDANWQASSPGYAGDVAINGLQADERTSGSFAYAGTIYTNDSTLGAWQQIVNNNPLQASGVTDEVARITALESDLVSAFQQINALTANPGDLPAPYDTNFDGTIQSLDGLNTENGIDEVFVINITSGFTVSSQINITGDPGDVFIFRWDTDADPTNGYQGEVKFQSGGAIVPQGGLIPTNFIHVAGDINSSGGGSTPPPPYPQGPRLDDGQGDLIIGGSDWTSGGFFTGYWLTTGDPTIVGPGDLLIGRTQSLSNGRFVGGWYSLTTQFSMTSGTAGVYVSPNPETLVAPAIDVEKLVSPDEGTTFVDADTPPGPNIPQGTDPIYRYLVTNTGNVPLENITLIDSILGAITIPTTTLDPGESFTVDVTGTWAEGEQVNLATATGEFEDITVTDEDPAHYVGFIEAEPAIDVEKFISADGGTTFFDADTPPGPNIPQGTNPVYRYLVTNTGNIGLEDITLTDDILGPITIPTTTLAPGESFTVDVTGTWAEEQQVNLATATGEFEDITVTDEDPAHYVGVVEEEPAIDVEKIVSVDGGNTFEAAPSPPGPTLPEGVDPIFRYIVTNTGNVPLENITLTDSVLGAITIPTTTLAPGESFTVDVTGN